MMLLRPFSAFFPAVTRDINHFHSSLDRRLLELSCEKDQIHTLQEEYNELEGLYQYYHYVRQRNEAQIDSFIDEKAQWEAQDQYDKDIITNHTKVLARMDELEKLMKSTGKEENTDDRQRLLEPFVGPTCSFENVQGGFEVSELGLTVMAAPSQVCDGLGLYIVLDEDTFEVEVPANTIISGYSQRGSFKEEAVEGNDRTVAFLFDNMKRGVIFEKKFQSLADVLESGKKHLLGHTVIENDVESLIVDPNLRLNYVPASTEELRQEDENLLYSPQEIGVYCNDLAFRGQGTTKENYDLANEKLNALELVWRLAEDETDETLLVPTWPVVITRKDVLFNNTEPMEIGLSYGWNYWLQTMKHIQ